MKYLLYFLALMLLLCLFKMPYGYYQFVRYLSFSVFAYLSYTTYTAKGNLTLIVWIYLFLAILFQPFVKIALGRSIWNIVDVTVAIGLIILASRKKVVD